MLPMAARAELKSLPKELADTVGAHLVAAGEAFEDDPQLAYRHAEAARRRAARLPIVREAAAEAAYAAGEYTAALREYRALRRMSGSDDYIPVIADCERAAGKPRAALELIRDTDASKLSPLQQVELLLVEAGARNDMGQPGEAIRLLESAISREKRWPAYGQARLRFAYAELLVAAGQSDKAIEWLEAAKRFDPEDELGLVERIAELADE